MAGIKGYRPSLQTTKLHKARTEPTSRPNYNGSGEAEVVPGFQIKEEILKFQQYWELEYPKEGLDYIESNVFMGPLQFIEDESTRCAVKVNVRYLSYILSGELQVVGYTKAEAILMALGREYKLKNGEIQTVPNPNWSPERWFEYMSERGCI